MIVGLDLSLNSTGICLFDEKNNEYFFAANINEWTLTGRKVAPTLGEFLEDRAPLKNDFIRDLVKLNDVIIDSHRREPGQGDGHIEIGHLRLINTDLLSKAIYTTLNNLPFFNKRKNDITAIGIEDYSIAKMTDDLVIVIEASTYLKQHYLLPLLKSYTQMFPIPGGKMKKLAGNGNADKFMMLMAFVDIQDPMVTKTPFHKFVKNNLQRIIVKGKPMKVQAPISDMIDAFWICRYTKQVILDGIPIPEKPKIKTIKK